MKEIWDNRYAEEGFAYGSDPNVYFKDCIDTIGLKKSILLPAEGEGRNAVYAASLGWDVTAFDISSEGREKAIQLAKVHEVKFNYEVKDFEEIYFNRAFDCVAFIYTHFTTEKKYLFFDKMLDALKPGGWVIFECFSVNNLSYRDKNPKIGGPENPNMLYSIVELQTIFMGYKIINLTEEVVTLNEGKYHNGEGCVIRLFAQKPIP
jgi:SAM-dependent methyltransferase